MVSYSGPRFVVNMHLREKVSHPINVLPFIERCKNMKVVRVYLQLQLNLVLMYQL
jgi:hypothetical protein